MYVAAAIRVNRAILRRLKIRASKMTSKFVRDIFGRVLVGRHFSVESSSIEEFLFKTKIRSCIMESV